MSMDAATSWSRERIHLECSQLLSRYAACVDAGDIEGLEELALPEIILRRPSEVRQGREAFLDLYRAFASSGACNSSHLISNVVASQQRPDSFKVTSSFLALATIDEGTRMTWGRYDDDFRSVEGSLRIAVKSIEIAKVVVVGDVKPSLGGFTPLTTHGSE